MKLTKWMAATALFLSFGVAGCTDDRTDEVSQLTRDTDEVSVAYNKDATARDLGPRAGSMVCIGGMQGRRRAGPTAAWLRLDPAEGSRQRPGLPVDHGDRRPQPRGETRSRDNDRGRYARRCSVEVKVTQDDGTFDGEKTRAFGRPESQCLHRMRCWPWSTTRRRAANPSRSTSTFDGDSRGLAIKDYTGTIEGEGSGKIELPITGTPYRYRRGETQHENDHRGQDDLRRRDFAQYPVREFHLLAWTSANSSGAAT